MDANGLFSPSFDEGEVARLKAWHDFAYADMKERAGEDGQTFDYLGLELYVPPTAHPITAMSDMLGHAILNETQPTDLVLDMGTGCGVNAILAATRGAHVVAVDINADALLSAQANAKAAGRADQIETRVSDVFSAVPESFDLIVFDPPFRWFPARDALEANITDEGYRTLTGFFEGARQNLKQGGRMLIFFGSSGDLAYLHSLIIARGFTAEIVNERTLTRDGYEVGYLTLRLTQI